MKELGTGNWGQGSGGRELEQGSGGWRQQTGDRELGTGNWGQQTGDRELGAGNWRTTRRRERVLLLAQVEPWAGGGRMLDERVGL